MFRRSNFRHLEEAVEEYTKANPASGTGAKSGLKLALFYLLKSTSKILRGTYLIEDNDERRPMMWTSL